MLERTAPGRHDPRGIPIGDLVFDARRRPHRLRDLRGRVGRQPARRRPRAARRRRDLQPVGEPLRVRQVRGAPALRDRGLARVRRRVPVRQPAGQRGRPGDLRRRRADRVGRRAVRARPAVLVPRRRADDRGDRHRRQPPRAGAARQPPPAPRRRGPGRSSAPFVWPSRQPEPVPAARAQRGRTAADVREEEFARAVALGLWDYLRKSRGQGYVVSLSGGADSAACAVLVALAVELALAELGPGGVRRQLGSCRRLHERARRCRRRCGSRDGRAPRSARCSPAPTSRPRTAAR